MPRTRGLPGPKNRASETARNDALTPTKKFGNDTGDPMKETADSLRIDRWLFFCRLFKTRTLATDAVAGGHVRVNGVRATAGMRVAPGDRIDVTRERLPYSLVVQAIPTRRGPASEARACYVEDEAVVAERNARSAALRQDRLLMPRTEGRPDKHTRRQLRARRRD